MNKGTLILGIETSCDETAAALYDTAQGIRSSVLFSQTALHKNYGGVVPELASREQLEKITSIVEQALQNAGSSLDTIDVIAVTTKPGLPGSLLVGLCFAKGLAYGKGKKIVSVNHLEGHVYSACIDNNVPFPHLCLTASGGHSALYLVNDFRTYTVLGQTVDDAAGEAFDKVSKMLELGYPGGPIIEKLAREVHFQDYFKYPRMRKKNLNFSFSGLKTAVLYSLVEQGAYDLQTRTFRAQDNIVLKQQVASSLLVCIKDIFIDRLSLALKQHPEVQAITFVGGVACNTYLREELENFARTRKIAFFTPKPAYCTDNAAMIAFVGSKKADHNDFADLTLDIF